MHRLSPYNITDSLIRSALYREIREQQQLDNWQGYEIQPDEVKNPEKIAMRVYGTKLDHLKWVVNIAAGLDDIRASLVSGRTLKLPPAVWLRQRIRYYKKISDGSV